MHKRLKKQRKYSNLLAELNSTLDLYYEKAIEGELVSTDN